MEQTAVLTTYTVRVKEEYAEDLLLHLASKGAVELEQNEADGIKLSDAVKKETLRRIEHYNSHPEELLTWEQVTARLRFKA